MRLFNKSFLKFTLGFLAIIGVSFLVMAAVSAYAAGVSKIIFTTEPQSIKTGELSEAITIQTQDSDGNSTPTTETLDLEFVSTSPTGEFLNASGNTVTKTMNSGTANRTFYYRDSTEGTFTLTIMAVGRVSGEEFTASQDIAVSNSSIAAPANNNSSSNSSGEVLGVSTGASTSGGSTTRVSSPNALIEIYALPDRVVSVGSPLIFQAVVKKNTSTDSITNFNWSYGDGNVGVGQRVEHTYKYPGDYLAVLNVRAGETYSVNRFKVKVLDTNMKVEVKENYIEISNSGSAETNLFNWKIEHGGKGFIFQPDTIVLSHASIKLEKSLLSMKGLDNSQGTVLKNSLGEQVASYEPIIPPILLQEIMPEKIATVLISAPTISEIPEEKIKEEIENNIVYESPQKAGVFGRAWNFIVSMLD